MPTTLLTLPREIRDKIRTYVALSAKFSFLLTCRQLHEEGTLLLYKHSSYRVRILSNWDQRIRARPQPPQLSLIQNLYISMPPVDAHKDFGHKYQISSRTSSFLSHLAEIILRGRVCHFNLQKWPLTAEMAEVLCGFGGFDVVRVEILEVLKPHDKVRADKRKNDRKGFIEETFGKAFGEAKWEKKDSVKKDSKRRVEKRSEILIAEFLPQGSRRWQHAEDRVGAVKGVADVQFCTDDLIVL